MSSVEVCSRAKTRLSVSAWSLLANNPLAEYLTSSLEIKLWFDWVGVGRGNSDSTKEIREKIQGKYIDFEFTHMHVCLYP